MLFRPIVLPILHHHKSALPTALTRYAHTSLKARFLPWPGNSARMSWDRVLQNYAALPNPEKSLQNGVYLTSDDHTLTIFDGYEKAKYHFLVLPREPFKLAAGGTVPKRDLDSLTTLFKSPHTKEVLEALKVAGEKVKAMIEDEMVKDEGFKWDIQVGFHAVESMK
ncbi:hypothetical protein MNV49_000023 [Pseudohyphozyma bogoriensis]|nr:hypothetical protein MNV49_000023 [Pseudohyphozyma bogoriensis]